jgi:hypothetical protein
MAGPRRLEPTDGSGFDASALTGGTQPLTALFVDGKPAFRKLDRAGPPWRSMEGTHLSGAIGTSAKNAESKR